MLFSAAVFVALGWLCARLSLFEAIGASIIDLSLIHEKVVFLFDIAWHIWQCVKPSIDLSHAALLSQALVSCVFILLASAFALLVWFFDALVRSDANAELRVRPPAALSSSSSSALAPSAAAATTTTVFAAAAASAASAAAIAAPANSTSSLPFSPAADHSGDVGGGSGLGGAGSVSAAAAIAMPAPVMGHVHALAAPRRTQSTSSFSRYSPLG
jgi:hypothetical protein